MIRPRDFLTYLCAVTLCAAPFCAMIAYAAYSDAAMDGIKPGPHHLSYTVTAYSHGCTLPRNGRERPAQRAANGRWPIADVTVAADPSHPFGAELLIEGVGYRTVGDRGHAIRGRRLDLFMATCREARRFGRRTLRVWSVPRETTRYTMEGEE